MFKTSALLPPGKYISLSIKDNSKIMIRASDELTENLSCESDEVFITYLEVSENGIAAYSNSDFQEQNYQQGVAFGLNLAADKIQALLEQNGVA